MSALAEVGVSNDRVFAYPLQNAARATRAPPATAHPPPARPQPATDTPSADLSETVYAHLRAIAQHKLAEERPGHTLQATALVHEAYLRLEKAGNPPAQGPQFYWAAAEAMRRILIEHA